MRRKITTLILSALMGMVSTMALAGDEAELAGVIAHEIGHVAARHGAQRMSSGIMAQLGLGLLSILTDSPELSGIAQLGAMAAIQGYSRDQEFEADMLGVHYLERAGFDTEAMASFLAKMRAHSEVEGRSDEQVSQSIGAEPGR